MRAWAPVFLVSPRRRVTKCCRPPSASETLSSPIPAASTWGVAVVALLLLIGGKVYFSRRAVAA